MLRELLVALEGISGWHEFAETQEFKPFNEARGFARSLGLGSQKEWIDWGKSGKRPTSIPSIPAKAYKDDWKGWGDWLGTGRIATIDRKYRPFNEARELSRSLGFGSQAEWRVWSKSSKRPEDVPAGPRRTYKDDWKGWGDWLGTGYIATFNRKYRPFEEARKFARSLGLDTQKEWQEWSKSGKMPKDVPAAPAKVYNDWKGWGDWLGTGHIATYNRKYRPFEEARKFARSLGLDTHKEWVDWSKSSKRPTDIPADPIGAYKDEWKGFGDWLGTGRVANSDKKFKSFNEARGFVKSLGLGSHKEWLKWLKSGKRPADVPSEPAKVYKDEWMGWEDWLGTE